MSLLMDLTVGIVSAYVEHNRVPATQLPKLIAETGHAVGLMIPGNSTEPAELLKPAVPIRRSIHDDYLICLDDGKKFKSLKRHLMSSFGLTPDEYRKRWELPADYPMVAPNYSAVRSTLAKKLGLGKSSHKRANRRKRH